MDSYYSIKKGGFEAETPVNLKETRDYFLTHSYGEWYNSAEQRRKFISVYGLSNLDIADVTGWVPENTSGECVGGRDWESKVSDSGPIFKIGQGVQPTPIPPSSDPQLDRIEGMLRELLRRVPKS